MSRRLEPVISILILLSLLHATLGVEEIETVSGYSDSTVRFEKSYDYSFQDWATDLIQVQDHGYVITGWTQIGSYQSGRWLVRTDVHGNMLWNKTYYNERFYQTVSSLIETDDHGYLFGQTIDASDSGRDLDSLLIKTDYNGIVEWNSTYGGENDDFCSVAFQEANGDLMLIGATDSYGAGSMDGWLIRADRNGHMIWNRTYGGIDSDSATSLLQTSDGGYALGGNTHTFGAGACDYWLLKLDTYGNVQWNKTFGGAQDEYLSHLIPTVDGGFVLAGHTEFYPYPGKSRSQIKLIKTDSEGNVQWSRIYGNPDCVQTVCSGLETSDGGFILVGRNWSLTHYGIMIKVQADGDMAWTRTFSGAKSGATDASMSAIIETEDNGYAICGSFYTHTVYGNDFWLVKTDSQGIVPEFTSFLILPLFMIATFLAVIVYRRKHSIVNKCEEQ